MVLSCHIFYDSRRQKTSSSYLSFAFKGKHFTHRIHSVDCRFYLSTFVVSYTCAVVSENQNKVGYYTGPLICTSWRSWQKTHHYFHKQDMKMVEVAQSKSQRQWQKDEGMLRLPSSYPLGSVIDRLVHSQSHPFNSWHIALNSITGHFYTSSDLYTISQAYKDLQSHKQTKTNVKWNLALLLVGKEREEQSTKSSHLAIENIQYVYGSLIRQENSCIQTLDK